MKPDNAIALAILCLVLVAQPFLHRFGDLVSVVPIAVFALAMLYFALRRSP